MEVETEDKGDVLKFYVKWAELANDIQLKLSTILLCLWVKVNKLYPP